MQKNFPAQAISWKSSDTRLTSSYSSVTSDIDLEVKKYLKLYSFKDTLNQILHEVHTGNVPRNQREKFGIQIRIIEKRVHKLIFKVLIMSKGVNGVVVTSIVAIDRPRVRFAVYAEFFVPVP